MNSVIPHRWDLRHDCQQGWSWLRERLAMLSRHQHKPLVLLLQRAQAEAPYLHGEMLHTLGPGERERLFAYRLEADRQRFLLGRGGIRRVLAEWLAQPPAEIKLEMGAFGKPFCPGGPEFNISHSGELVAIALHPSQPVGVDVERVDRTIDWNTLAKQYLELTTIKQIKAQPIATQTLTYLQAWCTHEAVLKADGRGLATCLGIQQIAIADCWNLKLTEGYLGSAALTRDHR